MQMMKFRSDEQMRRWCNFVAVLFWLPVTFFLFRDGRADEDNID
jgi:hypothetical protein